METKLGNSSLTGDPINEGWLFRLDGWSILYVDRVGVAVNDLRSSLAFKHRVWFAVPLEPGWRPSAVAGESPREGSIVVGGDVIAAVTVDPGRATHVDVRVIDPALGVDLFDQEVRYRQLPSPSLPLPLARPGCCR